MISLFSLNSPSKVNCAEKELDAMLFLFQVPTPYLRIKCLVREKDRIFMKKREKRKDDDNDDDKEEEEKKKKENNNNNNENVLYT